MAKSDRIELEEGFLAEAGWATAQRLPIAGDASGRSYKRLIEHDGKTAILMDAPREAGEDVAPFVRIARHLLSLGLSAPRILSSDESHGFLLLEDLGDTLFAKVIETDGCQEKPLYSCAVDVLISLHQHGPSIGVPTYTPELMGERASLAALWYLRGSEETDEVEDVAGEIEQSCGRLVEKLAPETSVLALRDYHAENLIWLPDRNGVARVGLLDFQDAMAGHPAYDLVSLLEDARRDVTPSVRAELLERYRVARQLPGGEFEAACAVLGAQRNLRILGVFARLSMLYGKPTYVGLIPRVWAHLQRNLAHPELGLLAEAVRRLPEPTTERLTRLREKCGTCQTR